MQVLGVQRVHRGGQRSTRHDRCKRVREQRERVPTSRRGFEHVGFQQQRPISLFHPSGTQCEVTAFSAPTPVSVRTSNSAFTSGLPRSDDVKVPTMPRMNASGIDTMPGLASGNQAKSTFGIIAVLAPDTAGEKMISTIVEISPPYMLHSAPRVLNRSQYSEYRMVGRLAAAATANASATRNAMFCPLARMPSPMPSRPSTTAVIRDTRTCSASVTLCDF